MRPYSFLAHVSAARPALSRLLAVLLIALVSGGESAYTAVAGAGAPDEPGKPAIASHLSDPLTREGFDHFYNMEYDQAIADFEKVVAAHPDDPYAVNHLLTGVLFRELYHIGALDTELYAKDSFLTSKQFPINSITRSHIQDLMTRATQLSEDRLKKNPNDLEALYSRGVTRGMRSTYIGLVDKAWFAALRSAVGARRDHERVLELDPNYQDAKMIVGIHNYVLGSLPWTVKVAASLVGLSGSRQKGIEYLYEAGRAGGETSIDARIALSLFLRREQRYPEAITLVGGLANEHPRNFLFRLEYAHLLNAAGHGQEAVAAYRKVLEDAKAGHFAESRLEMAEYGLGEALRGQRDFSGAAEAYDTVQTFPKVDPDMRQRASLGAGEMYDKLGQRDLAVQRYQAALNDGPDSPRGEQAKKYLKQPFHD